MLENYIIDILELLVNMNPVFTEGYIYNRRDANRGLGEMQGNYFYLVEDVGSSGHNGSIEPLEQGPKAGYFATETWKMLVNIKCVDRFLILKRLIGQLILKTPGISLNITGYSTDSEAIYLEETGHEMQQNIDIIRINFTISRMLSTDGLDCQSICDEDCC